MEIILAIVVASAVIFFGTLISMGNERQKKAIDELKEQVSLWAVQDLKLKREHLAQTVQVPDPLGWLNRTASKALGHDPNLHIVEIYEEPQAILCISDTGNMKIIFSSFSPADISRLKNSKKSQLSKLANHHPLLLIPKITDSYEFSVLNGGYLFDLELALVLREIIGQDAKSTNTLWMYIV